MWYAVIGKWALLLSPFTGAETEAGETPSSLGSEKKKMEPALSGMDDRQILRKANTMHSETAGFWGCVAVHMCTRVGVSQAGE